MKRLIIFLSAVFFVQSAIAEFMCEDIKKYRGIYNINSYTCKSGEFLPANTLGCQSCPNGATCNGGTFDFNPNKFQGLTINNISSTTLNNICADNMFNKLRTIYEPNVHTCSAGYYLPANVDACTICPQNSFCSGGTFTFNETTDQGIYPHILHVGNNVVYLRPSKLTTPSLNIKIGNDIFYANMTTTQTYMNKDSQQHLKVQYGNNLYYVCDDTTCPH